MNLTTNYLGMQLKNPLVPSASTLSTDEGNVKKMEDSGASAVVLYSLFEEQISNEQQAMEQVLHHTGGSYAEALTYFPEPEEYHNLHAEEYLDYIRRLKESLDIPVIASLNGTSKGGWTAYAKKMEQAGADAIELNIYRVAADPSVSGESVERMYLDDVKAVRNSLNIPVSVKLGPHFSSFANLAVQLEGAGADGLVLFNRFYQPDIDLDRLEVEPSIELSSTFEKRLPLRWIALLRPHLKGSLAATTGIHGGKDVIKMLLVGADVAMMASVLLKEGVTAIPRIMYEMLVWMNENEYDSVQDLQGAMSAASIADPEAFERANYLRALQGYHIKRLRQ